MAQGYSGFGIGKNNPAMQDRQGIGPLPQGDYTIGQMIESTQEHGPFVLPLEPAPWDELFGRSGFMIHGDSKLHAGCASHGCIVIEPAARLAIANSLDKCLRVTA